MTRATLVATLTSEPKPAALAAIAGMVDVLEVRADLVPDVDPDTLRESFPGRLLYTLRSREEGGAFAGALLERQNRLQEAAGRYELLDLEVERDLDPHLLARVPPERRILSWHGPAVPLEALEERLAAMTETPAALYKLVPAADRSGRELVPLRLLEAAARSDVIAFATGPVAAWSRLVAPRLGAPWVYGSLGETAGAPGQISIADLVRDYGLPELRPVERLCGVVGNPVLHSLSPRLHNGACRELGLPYLYVPFHVEEFGEFWLEVVEDDLLDRVGLPLVGLSVTTPHKSAALAVAAVSSPLAETLEAANTLARAVHQPSAAAADLAALAGDPSEPEPATYRRSTTRLRTPAITHHHYHLHDLDTTPGGLPGLDLRDGVWEAENTDVEGVIRALEERGIEGTGRRAVVVGAGRAGRAAAFGLHRAGAEVVVANRSETRGREVADLLGIPFRPLGDLDPSEFEIVVHATSLGREPGDEAPIDPEALRPDGVLVELVYGVGPTLLERRARERGLTVIDGREVLVAQALAQFRLFTGHEISIELGRRILEVAP